MGSLKLLVVEDDLPSLELMEEVFTSLQADVRPINNSETAAALVGKEKFDGIFLDLEMPPVSDGETMQRSFSVGASYFLEKPVGRQKLSRLLRTVRGRAAVACAFRSTPK